MTENHYDQYGQDSSTSQQQNQGNQQNQDTPRGVEDLSTTNTQNDEQENKGFNHGQCCSSDSYIGHKTYSGIAEIKDFNDKSCSNQDCNSENDHLENHNFQGDNSTGQVKFQGGPTIPDYQNRDQFSSPNIQNDENDRDVSQQNEISHPERERSTTTPYGGNSNESNRRYNQSSDMNDDETPVDDSTLLK